MRIGKALARFGHGMKPLRISGAMKIAAGVTSIDEVMKVAPSMKTRRPLPS